MISRKLNITGKPWQIILLSALILLVLSVTSVGYYHPDEHFQILEFAALKLHLTTPENLPWEYPAMMRPAIQPAIVVLTHHVFSWFGCTNPFSITLFLRILSSALSLLGMWMIYRSYTKEIREPMLHRWFLLLSFLLWFILYNNVRFSSETWSGSLFIIGFSYLFCLSRKPRRRDFLFAGLLLGLSFIVRFQSGFLVAGFLAWLILAGKERLINVLFLCTGILTAVFAGILIDHWFYGDWTLTAWNYFQQNILADKVSGFGISPWYFYFTDIFIRAIPPFSLAIFLAAFIFFLFKPRDLITWTLLPFILVHFLIGHKETRFFYPLIGFVPVMVIRGIEVFRAKWSKGILENRFFLGFIKTYWIVNLLLIVFSFFNPADGQVRIYEKIYDHYKDPVTLYYLNENPYHRALDVYYYRRPNLVIRKAESVEQLDSNDSAKFLVAAKSGNKDMEKIRNKRVIGSSFPEWIRFFNVNQWVERTSFWNVFEVDNRKQFKSKY